MTMRPQQITTLQTPQDTFGGITEMISAIMPLIMIVMIFRMLGPMLSGMAEPAK